MLVLTRKTNETILIDGQIEVSIIEVRGSRVKLGIKAPESVSIRRNEIAMKPREREIQSCAILGSGI